jgi:PAS domain S-box-containing protein
MRRVCGQRLIREQEEQLRLLFESAMDGILVLDAGISIKALNPSALRTFGCDKEEDIVGESVLEFLSVDSASSLESLASELTRADPGDRCIWIPENLTAKRWDNSEFPAEASLSCFELGSECRFCLIIRDIADVIESEKHVESLRKENRLLRENVKHLSEGIEIIGQCPSMRQLGKDIRRVAATDASVLIVGETGVGKELVARAVHSLSLRNANPLVCLNCAALPENLVESELFGHEKGAFTGATSQRDGRFALADGGTLFLDEIGELPLNAQAKVLRTLQEGVYEPLGGDRSITTDVRIIVATHRDLPEMVAQGTFREDLYYRLNVFPLEIPPLRSRGDDIVLLANEFLKTYARELGRRAKEISPRGCDLLRTYDWPGNVRELQNTIERALIISNSPEIDLESAMSLEKGSDPPAQANDLEQAILTDQEFREFEKRNIELALISCGGRISGSGGAAARMGLKPTTLNSRIKALEIRAPV